jgi:hypothetical protein
MSKIRMAAIGAAVLLAVGFGERLAATNEWTSLTYSNLTIGEWQPPPNIIIESKCGSATICLTNGAVELAGCMTNLQIAASNFWATITQMYPDVRETIKRSR